MAENRYKFLYNLVKKYFSYVNDRWNICEKEIEMERVFSDYGFEMSIKQSEVLGDAINKIRAAKTGPAYFFIPEGVFVSGTKKVNFDTLTAYIFVEDRDFSEIFHISEEFLDTCVPFMVSKKAYDTNERGVYFDI